MALIQCPSCTNPVSSAAPQCPNCGLPIAGKKTEETTGISAIIVVIGIGTTCWLMFKLVPIMENYGMSIGLSSIPTVLAFILASLRKK